MKVSKGLIYLWLGANLLLTGCGNPKPGIVAPLDPIQVNLDGSQKKVIDIAPQFKVEFLASYKLKARVLSTHSYKFDTESEIAPVDLALGWKKMSDYAIYSKMDILQQSRFYFWRPKEAPISKEEIIQSSSNTHMVPADNSIKDILEDVDKDDVIEAEGFLIHAFKPNGWQWWSSVVRTDTGNGACEIFYVTKLKIIS